jgi:hypothetical protein
VQGGFLYARKTANFPGLKGKESCKKWQCSFFYVKNLKKGADYVNLPPFDANGPGEQDSWNASLPSPTLDMVKILQRITALQKEGNLKPSDLLLAFLDARVSSLQRRSHKMCFLGSTKDPTRHSSRALTAVEVVQKANRIIEVKLPASWAWGLRPYDRSNPVAEVRLLGLASAPLFYSIDDLTIFYLACTEPVRSTDCGELGLAPGWLRRR